MSLFERYIAVDYSGAATPETPLTGIRVYVAATAGEPTEIHPPPGTRRRKHWSRSDLAHWLVQTINTGPPTCIGIDHGFSFPIDYFQAHGLRDDWDGFLVDFARHWPSEQPGTTIDSIRNGLTGHAAARTGSSRWRRMVEIQCRAKSVFHFDVQGSVAKSTHAGLPWLLHLRRNVKSLLHFWPFDGWLPPHQSSVICEIYPSLYRGSLPTANRNPHQQDAWATVKWLRQQDAAGTLTHAFTPPLPIHLAPQSRLEGWILGVTPSTNPTH